ncbi:MAG: transposase [bacterium]
MNMQICLKLRSVSLVPFVEYVHVLLFACQTGFILIRPSRHPESAFRRMKNLYKVCGPAAPPAGFPLSFIMPTHHDEPSHAHFLTFGTFHHVPLFKHENLCAMFLQQLALSRKQLGFQLWAFVVMPDHVHLLLYPQGDVSITHILSSIKRGFAWQALQFLREGAPKILSALQRKQRGNVTHHIWQAGGGHDRNIFGDEALRKTMEYIHGNPVRKGLVGLPEEWPWSSAGFWLTKKHGLLVPDIPEWWRDGM